jgi:hypothetical protein
MKKTNNQAPSLSLDEVLNAVYVAPVEVLEVVEEPTKAKYDVGAAIRHNIERNHKELSDAQVTVLVNKKLKKLSTSVVNSAYGRESVQDLIAKCILNNK